MSMVARGGGRIVPTHSQPQWYKAEGGQHHAQAPLPPRRSPLYHFTGRSEGSGSVYPLNPRPSSPVVLVGKVNRNASCGCMFVKVNVTLHVTANCRLAPWWTGDFRSSGMLHSADWWVGTKFSGHPIGPSCTAWPLIVFCRVSAESLL
jgi:hypothetical protein